jgi:outer membrane biosynthesis protein TonB
MRKGIIGSALLHGGVVAASVIAWPHAFDFSDETPPAIPVELLSVADVTNIMASVRKEDLEAPPPEEIAPPAEEQTPAEEPTPEEEGEVAPSELEPDKAEPLPEPEETEMASKAPPKPVAPRAKPKPEPKKKDTFDVDSVLALLDRRTPKTAPPANAQVADRTTRGIGDRNAATMDIRDAIFAQMRECWNIPAGAPNPEKLIVAVRVYLTQDGKLARPPELAPESRGGAASNPYMRAAAEAALRAVNVCEPYRNLPLDKYDVWREITVVFDPSKAAGR